MYLFRCSQATDFPRGKSLNSRSSQPTTTSPGNCRLIFLQICPELATRHEVCLRVNSVPSFLCQRLVLNWYLSGTQCLSILLEVPLWKHPGAREHPGGREHWEHPCDTFCEDSPHSESSASVQELVDYPRFPRGLALGRRQRDGGAATSPGRARHAVGVGQRVGDFVSINAGPARPPRRMVRPVLEGAAEAAAARVERAARRQLDLRADVAARRRGAEDALRALKAARRRGDAGPEGAGPAGRGGPDGAGASGAEVDRGRVEATLSRRLEERTTRYARAKDALQEATREAAEAATAAGPRGPDLGNAALHRLTGIAGPRPLAAVGGEGTFRQRRRRPRSRAVSGEGATVGLQERQRPRSRLRSKATATWAAGPRPGGRVRRCCAVDGVPCLLRQRWPPPKVAAADSGLRWAVWPI